MENNNDDNFYKELEHVFGVSHENVVRRFEGKSRERKYFLK
jgi:hypothetical protein